MGKVSQGVKKFPCNLLSHFIIILFVKFYCCLKWRKKIINWHIFFIVCENDRSKETKKADGILSFRKEEEEQEQKTVHLEDNFHFFWLYNFSFSKEKKKIFPTYLLHSPLRSEGLKIWSYTFGSPHWQLSEILNLS